jgi:hypothetical protein
MALRAGLPECLSEGGLGEMRGDKAWSDGMGGASTRLPKARQSKAISLAYHS